jgi:5'-deoxynucleotidase YfbR-like HD superfamily hydrolase
MIVKALLSDYLARLDNIVQWQERDVHQHESVAQHSYKVTVFTNMLLESLFQGQEETIEILRFKNDCINHAMFHDWDEALILRDLSHKMKYNDYNGDAIRKVVDDLAEHLAEQEFIVSDAVGGKRVYDGILPTNKLVHAVVKVADWMALQYFVDREVRMGNRTFNIESRYCPKSLSEAIDKMLKAFKKSEFKVNTKQMIDIYYEYSN